MAWFRVEDSFATHPKVLVAGTRAIGLWTLAGTWSAAHLTEGHIPATVVALFGRPTDAQALVTAGLWDEADGGYRFHDWLHYQPTAAEVREARHLRAEAGRKGGIASGVTRRRNEAKPKQTRSKTEASASGLHEENEANSEANAKQNRSKTEPRPVPTHLTEPNGSAQTIIADWLDHCPQRPPDRVIGQLAKEIGSLVAEGFPTASITRAVATWNSRGLHPSTLASIYHELQAPRSNGTQKLSGPARALALAATLADTLPEIPA